MLMEQNPSSSRTDRKTIEKNRRNQMKELYSQLNSLVPHHPSREGVYSLPDQIDEATKYIKKLQIKLEKMKDRKGSLLGIENPKMTMPAGLKPPHIDIKETGSAIEVVLITGLDFQFMFSETIRMLHEEGADVVNASISIIDDTVFHTVHSKVGDHRSPGYEASRISERLKKFVSSAAKSFEV